MNPTITLKDIEAAGNRIHRYINQTPILTSSLLNEWLGHELYFKAECLQKVGAFKARGACNTVSWLLDKPHKPGRIIANSSGNHAQAVAWAASQFKLPSTLFMPAYSSQVKIQATRAYGAHIELCENRNVADEKVTQASKVDGNYWIPPFNHPQVIAGQGTIMLEALQQVNALDAVFAACGGGGLLSGTLVTTRALSPATQILGVEPLQANDAAESLRRNAIQRLQDIPKTLADGAMTMAIGELTFAHLKQLDGMYEVDEEQIIYWTQWLTHLLKLHIEPTSAMTMEGAFQWLKQQKSKKRILVILSGGNIDQETQQKIWHTNVLDTRPNA